jgi:hypothetical protein
MRRPTPPVPPVHNAEETEVSVALTTEDQDEAAGRLVKMFAAAKGTKTSTVTAKVACSLQQVKGRPKKFTRKRNFGDVYIFRVINGPVSRHILRFRVFTTENLSKKIG